MIDEFDYASPLGWIGKLADILFIRRYMQQLLAKRNEWIEMHAGQCLQNQSDY